MIDPKSTAGVLLREHDNLTQAAEYAERKARFLLSMQNGLGMDYAEAARQLRAEADRPAFEAWLRRHWSSPGYACTKDALGTYVDAETQTMWEARSAKRKGMNAAKTTSERVRAMRSARDALGLKRLELYAHTEDWPAIKALAEKLQRRRARLVAKSAG